MARWTAIAAGGVIGLLVWTAGCSRTDAGRSADKVGKQVPPQSVAKDQAAQPDTETEVRIPVTLSKSEAKPPEASPDSVAMILSFIPGQTTSYKLTTHAERRVDYSGNVPKMPEELKNGHTSNQIEMTYEQHVETVNADGSAVLKITIKSLTYKGEASNKVVLDFDSSRAADAQNPLAKLIGQSYMLTMSPNGAVQEIINARPARAAIAGNLPANQTAQKLISDEAIKERHGVTPLIAAQRKTVRQGDTWADVKVISFGRMGTDTLQQNYKLVSIEQSANRRVAVVEMEAIPSAAMAQQLHQQLKNPVNPGVLDNTQKDVGRLRWDLTNQRIDEYTEDLTKEWVTALQEKDLNGGVIAMKMTAIQQYRLERME
jgi:hypothetical protein